MKIEDIDEETLLCAACGDECPGADACNGCGATLCGNCESEYDDQCSLCFDEHYGEPDE